MNIIKRMTRRRLAGLGVFVACLCLVMWELLLIAFSDDYLLSDLAHEYVGGINSVTLVGGVGIGLLLNHFIFRW